MTSMTKHTLVDCFSLRARIGWQGLRSDEFKTEGPYLVTGVDFHNGRVDWDDCYHITEERYAQDKGIQLHEHDLLITKDGTIGKTAVVIDCPEKATLNSGVFVVRAINNEVVPKFLHYVLHSHWFDLFVRNVLTGSTIKHLNQEKFYKFSFETPDVPTQKKIVEVLEAIDDAIEKSREMIIKYTSIKKGLLQDLLKIGTEKSFGDVAVSFDYGLNTAATSYDGLSKYIRITDIDDETHEFSQDDLTTPDGLLTDEYLLHENDIVFARTGATTGKTYLYNPDDGKVYFAGFLIRMRVKPEYDARYIFYQTQTDEYKRWVQINSLRSGQPGINAKQYKKYNFMCPDLPEQTRIANIILNADLALLHERQLLKKLQNVRNGLIKDMLSGNTDAVSLT